MVEESTALDEDQFISEAMVGECPECGSANTVDCDEVEGIYDIEVGLCGNCGYLWCLECGSHLTSGIICGHWEICSNCAKEKDEFGSCGIPPLECKEIKNWLEKEGG